MPVEVKYRCDRCGGIITREFDTRLLAPFFLIAECTRCGPNKRFKAEDYKDDRG